MSEKLEIIEELGSGGFATTYKARVIDEELLEEIGCEIVAVKVPNRSYYEIVLCNSRLSRLHCLTSPNLVRFLDVETYHHKVVILVEFVPGNLRRLTGPISNENDSPGPTMPLEKVLQITCGILNGLSAFHQEKFVHRNIKPENILMDGDVPKISDLFFSQLSRHDHMMWGWRAYVAPEIVEGEPVSFTTDIWSTGVVLYEMLTGVLPFGIGADASTGVIFERICNDDPLPPSHYAEIPPEIDAIVLDALRKDPQERIPDAEAFLARLDTYDQSSAPESSAGAAKPKSAGKAIGIDFGQNNSVVAHVRDGVPEVLYNRQGQALTPSVVGYRRSHRQKGEASGQILVGMAALKNYPMAPADTILSIRRLMGIGCDDPEVDHVRRSFQYEVIKPREGSDDALHVVMGGSAYSTEDIAAMIFSQLREDAENRLGEPVTRAVITVPAYFDQARKEAVHRAGVLAGLNVLQLLAEPTAAAIAYGMDKDFNEADGVVVVYDLGSDTFDASVLMCHGGTFTPMNIEGDRWLGTDQFDQEIIDDVVDWIKEDHGVDPTENRRFMSSLKLAAQEARESLSHQNSAEIIIPNLLQDKNGSTLDIFVEITREKFEGMIAPYVDRSLAIVEKAIENAGLDVEAVHAFLLSGQGTRTPLVEQKLVSRFGKARVRTRRAPELVVAEGAAIAAESYKLDPSPQEEEEESRVKKELPSLELKSEESPSKTKAGLLVGIDLGTTNSAIAYMRGKEPEVLHNRFGTRLTPSVVSLRRSRHKGNDEKGEILVGKPALRNYPKAPRDTIMAVKRLMGMGYGNPEVENVKKCFQYEIVKPAYGTEDAVRVILGGMEYSPDDISAMILTDLKKQAEDQLGKPVTHAVITVPAYFDQAQRAATRRAALKAGIKVLKLLNEPTAAVIACGMEEAESDESKVVVVYDLGSSFDVSVLMLADYHFVFLDIEGDRWLGGDNFDQEIINYVVELIKEDYGVDPTEDERFMIFLKLAAREAKESLSYQNSAEIILPNLLQDQDGFPLDIWVDITREQFEAMIEPYVDRSIALVEKAIAAAGFWDEDIDCILMAGGASKTPLVEEKITARFGGKRVLKRKQPKHCMAEGAAIIAKIYASVMCPNPTCEHTNALDAAVCSECGTVLNKLICINCGAYNEPGVDICRTCGKNLDYWSDYHICSVAVSKINACEMVMRNNWDSFSDAEKADLGQKREIIFKYRIEVHGSGHLSLQKTLKRIWMVCCR